MKLMRSIITLYEEFFRNNFSELILEGLNENEKKAFEFFEASTSKELDDASMDRMLFIFLYGKSGNREAYKSFKRKFKKKLRHIASLTNGDIIHGAKEKFGLLDTYTAVYKMMYLGLRDPVIKEAELLLSQAIKMLNYKIARDTCWILVHHYCQFETEKKHRDHYNSIYQNLNKLCDIEYKAQIIYGEALKSKNSDTINQKRINSFLKNMRALGKSLDEDSLYYYFYYYKINLLFTTGLEYKKWCLEAIDYYSKLDSRFNYYVSMFRNRIINYYLEINQYRESESNLLSLLNGSKKYTNIWYRYSITLIRVYLRLGNYQNANKWHTLIINSRKFRTLEKSHRTNLLILGMYVKLGLDKTKEVKLHRIRYNVIYQKHPIEDEVLNFLAAEIICLIKNGNTNVERHLKILRERSNGDKRCLAFCDTVEFGKKYTVEESSSFEKEIIEYEKLIRMM